ncbi:hypothetical protein [Chitinophaga costaii]|nr:hypothetical protein [Chitinophaga costaii]
MPRLPDLLQHTSPETGQGAAQKSIDLLRQCPAPEVEVWMAMQ